MTRNPSTAETSNTQPSRRQQQSQWRLQDAKARFSELVRLAHSDGPQHVSLHGHDAVVVVAAEEFSRLTVARTGAVLVQALQASPYPQLDIAPPRQAMPVRAFS